MSTNSLWLVQVALIIFICDTSSNDVEFVIRPIYFIYFDIVGKHEHSVSLTYTPCRRNAVCCNADYIFVAEYDGNVHVYTWMGLHIQKLSLHSSYICAIQCSHDGTVLQLATRDGFSATCLLAYKVSYISMAFLPHTHCPIIQVNFHMKRSKSIKTPHEMCRSYP